jgi:hypothetical protein
MHQSQLVRVRCHVALAAEALSKQSSDAEADNLAICLLAGHLRCGEIGALRHANIWRA